MGSRDSSTKARTITTPTTAMTTLTRKMLRQPNDSVRKPPTVGPMARPTEATAVHRPIALAFILALGKAALTRASEATFTIAAPTPWMPRPRLRTNRLGAAAHRAEAPANSTVPDRNMRRRPIRSDRVAADMMNMPIVRL